MMTCYLVAEETDIYNQEKVYKKKLPNKNENENEGVTPLENLLIRAIMTISPDPAERFTGCTFMM
jgi:hypothetical protein